MAMTAREIRSIADPVERFRVAKEAMDESRAEYAAVTREAALEIYRSGGGGYGAVATALGVSRARAQQLINPSPSQV